MSNVIIEVKDLSKNFIINHEGRERYTALRDVIEEKAKKIFSFTKYSQADVSIKKSSKEEFWALKDLNFDIKQGDRVGIIGRNGAGKSTLLKIISRITQPSLGEIRIKGRISSLLEVGTGFHPELSGKENIFLNGAILGMTRAEIRCKFDEIVDFAEVEQFLDTPVKRYSSGMYVKLAFAVAAHLEPEVLVVDEVLAVGDTEFQKKCLGKMEDISKGEGRTILFVSHNMGSIQLLCNQSIFLQNGKLLTMGTTNEVIREYMAFAKVHGAYEPADLKSVNKLFFFKKIFLTDSDNKIKSVFSCNEDFNVHFEIGNNASFETSSYSIFLMIIDPLKQKVGAIESDVIKGDKLAFKISRHYLVRGQYSIQAFIHKPRQVQLDVVDEACTFEMVDSGSNLSVHGDYNYGNTFISGHWI